VFRHAFGYSSSEDYPMLYAHLSAIADNVAAWLIIELCLHLNRRR
jgi:hypothetical protein